MDRSRCPYWATLSCLMFTFDWIEYAVLLSIAIDRQEIDKLDSFVPRRYHWTALQLQRIPAK